MEFSLSAPISPTVIARLRPGDPGRAKLDAPGFAGA